jgi:CRP-like cAMP-binding protein
MSTELQQTELSKLELRQIVIDFMTSLGMLTSEEVEALADLIQVKQFKKRTFLYKEGENWDNCYFVLRGALREYLMVDGVEKTIQFFFEHDSAVKFTHHIYKNLADSCLVCIEDSIVMIGNYNPEQEAEIYKKYPNLEQITRMSTEQDLAKMQDFLSSFMTSTPTERYENLINSRPDLLQRVPLHQIASYIGVTPESLSRIRKKIVSK